MRTSMHTFMYTYIHACRCALWNEGCYLNNKNISITSTSNIEDFHVNIFYMRCSFKNLNTTQTLISLCCFFCLSIVPHTYFLLGVCVQLMWRNKRNTTRFESPIICVCIDVTKTISTNNENIIKRMLSNQSMCV